MLEKQVEEYLTRKVRERGGLSRKWSSPSHRGVPDRIIILPTSGVWFVEVKTSTGKLTELQKRELNTLKSHGAQTAVVYGKEGVDEWLLTFA